MCRYILNIEIIHTPVDSVVADEDYFTLNSLKKVYGTSVLGNTFYPLSKTIRVSRKDKTGI